MMPNLNKVMLMGNLTRDPELRYTPANTAVCAFSLAINREWFNKQTNEKQKETCFVDCEAWGKTAEVVNRYTHKGDPIYVEGRLKLERWQDKESGSNRSKMKAVVEFVQFLGQREKTQEQQPNAATTKPQNHEPVDEGDIPF